jgi:prophage regulatory protein
MDEEIKRSDTIDIAIPVKELPRILSLTRNKVMRVRQVQGQTGLSNATLYRRIREGSFPKPFSLGGRSVGWLEEEVVGWISKNAALRGSA